MRYERVSVYIRNAMSFGFCMSTGNFQRLCADRMAIIAGDASCVAGLAGVRGRRGFGLTLHRHCYDDAMTLPRRKAVYAQHAILGRNHIYPIAASGVADFIHCLRVSEAQ